MDQSGHASGSDPVLAWTSGGVMLVIVFVRLAELLWRLQLWRSSREVESVVSRAFAFLVNNWLFLVCALFVLGATMWPTFTEWRMLLAERYPDLLGWQNPGSRVVINESFFNQYMRPLGLALLLLTGIGPLLAWRKTSTQSLVRQFAAPLVFGVVVVVAWRATGLESSWGLACFGLCGFTFWTIVQEFYRGVALRRKQRPQGVLEALISLVLRARRRYGGYIVHLGVVLMFLGWAGNSYKIENRLAHLKPGETLELGAYTIRHDGLHATEDWQKEMITADIAVLKDGEVKDVLHPARWWYYQLPEQPTTEVSRYMTAGEDVYVSMQEVDMTSGWTQLSLYINPLINWIWIGFGVMLAGSLVCVGTRKSEGAGEDV